MYSTGNALALSLTCPAGKMAEPGSKDMMDKGS